MPPEFATDSNLWGAVFASAVVGAGFVLSFAVWFGFKEVLKRRRDPDPTDSHVPLDMLFLTTMKGPVALILAALGILLGFLTVAETYEELSRVERWTERIWAAMVILAITYLLAHTSNFVISWYVKSYSKRTGTHLDDLILPIIGRVLPTSIYAVGTLVALNNVGVSISPVLAGLGITGLAVALAVQPTLSNFFAGAYLMAEREMKVGDYIYLTDGLEGYIDSIGWRSTKIKTFYNTLVIIPNSKLANTVITNLDQPGGGIFIMLRGGISYENDLAKVREIATEEIHELVAKSPHSVKDYEPWFGYENFGDSNAEFWIFYKARDLMGTFHLTSEGIERLHERFRKDGIKRNYPIREVLYPPSNGGVIGGQRPSDFVPSRPSPD